MRRTSWLIALALVAAACTTASTPPPSTEAPPPPTVAATTTTTAVLPPSTTTSSTEVPPPPPTVPESPAYGGRVIVGDDQEPPTLNPLVPGGDNRIVLTISEAINVGAYDINPVTYELEPDVLTELPTVANGGITVNEDGTMTVRYRIREEAVWADGVPISGSDFRFTYETVAGLGDWDVFDGIIPASVEDGPKTFTFTMREPTLEHQRLFGVVVPEHSVAGSDFVQDWNTQPWVSGGPFVLDKWVRGEHILLVRNDSYWRTNADGSPLPYLDTVLIRFIPEFEAMIGMYLSGEIDVADVDPRASFERLEGSDAELIYVDGPIWEHINFQFGVNNPIEDTLNDHLEFRRAVAHAIDRQVLANLGPIGSTGNVMRSYADAYQPGLGGIGWDHYEHDPAKARRLIDELCARLARDCDAEPPRVRFWITRTERRPLADAVAAMLAAAGIEAEIQDDSGFIDFGESPLEGGFWDTTMWAWIGGPSLSPLVDIHDVFDPDGPPPIGDNYYRWGTPEVTDHSQSQTHVQGKSRLIDEHSVRFADLVDAMHATVDEVELLRLAAEAEEILADQVIILPLYRRGHITMVRITEVGGVVPNPLGTGLLWNVATWHRADERR